jgi:hypothetical protein
VWHKSDWPQSSGKSHVTGFQKLDPSLNAGIDFSREVEHARQLLESKPG